ncbi:helix-turn-helix domain-containing protein [Dubosiella newyorkensis]|uniref:helix-turn-helix domain-containing protein n=1 Tax=Dubosiella newyorkensis TaxID=1862672 RepID=UPI0026F3C256|nr:XRE family transcriptional regulator [Dubosiella newyorkensis]
MIGEQLKKIRKQKNLTLEQVSALTSVSKPMLGQIERGRSVPTITTLWKLATGLKVPLSTFLIEEETKYTIIDQKKEEPILSEKGKMRAYTIFLYDPLRNFETFYIEFDSECKHTSLPHDENVEETIFVIEGELTMKLKEEEVQLKKGQAIRFFANIEHTYQNKNDQICKIYNTIFY